MNSSKENPAPAWWIRALGRVPLPVMYALAGAMAFLMRDVLRYRVSVARANLAAALPELAAHERRQILRKHYDSLAAVLFELPHLATMAADELRARMELPDMPGVRGELARGTPVLVLAAHQGNWEWLLQALALGFGAPFLAAYKPPHSEAADRLMLGLRGRFGTRMVPGKRLLREVLRRRGTAHAIGMVADQVPTSSPGRVWLEFFGRETAFFPGPAEIARAGRYSVYFLALRRVRRGYYVTRFEPIASAGEDLDVPTLVGRYAARVEALVREHPEDWAWTHRRWKLQPPA
ncbi:MAG: lysophospholipid acyltransferase family protein [Steroidobacteraceae bacterium]